MLIADGQGYYIDVNPAAYELFGLPKSELLGCNISHFSAPNFDFALAWSRFLEQGELKGFRLFCRNETVLDTEFSASANILPHRHLSIRRDITERKQGKELADANEKLKYEIRSLKWVILQRL